MIKLENYEVVGCEHALRGMRNPKNSWDRSDSGWKTDFEGGVYYEIGKNDHKLAMSLAEGGPVHAKYRRMITVYVDITAPLDWSSTRTRLALWRILVVRCIRFMRRNLRWKISRVSICLNTMITKKYGSTLISEIY